MPNYDAGHYFLTILAPIRPEPDISNGISRSRRNLIQKVLTFMPSGERTGTSLGNAAPAPFARSTRTHFARFVVLDDTVFNGRVSSNNPVSLVTANPLIPQKVDRLTTPYLIFVADFDAESGDDAVLKSYATDLWETMADELTSVFQHCIGFDGIETGEQFFKYLKRCQVETTMPFNDYWSVAPALPVFNYWPYVIAAAAAAIMLALAAFAWKIYATAIVLAVAIVVALLVAGIRNVFEAGAKPFPKSPPPAPASTLPSVLKALYLQSRFAEFAIAAQGLGDAKLHAEFGKFLSKTKPGDLDGPTQKPGIIGVDAKGALV